VEENECRRAHDLAVEKYTQVFKKDVILDEVRYDFLSKRDEVNIALKVSFLVIHARHMDQRTCQEIDLL